MKMADAKQKRNEQLKRWIGSETDLEPPVVKRQKTKVKFDDGAVFLAACSSGDTDEVLKLLHRGADINYANVDGLTALHQACIDDNVDMVKFLVENGANINQPDNEGWIPLHAAASCGYLDIAEFLIGQGAHVGAVNSEGDTPLDIAEEEAMEELLQNEVNRQGVDIEAARKEEERIMLRDARQWLNSGHINDVRHAKSGGTALHVAAAKGYTEVLKLLIQAGYDVNIKDYDGWTPLHAAAHWGKEEACRILVDNLCDMEMVNKVGQTAFDVADEDILGYLEELQKKQNLVFPANKLNDKTLIIEPEKNASRIESLEQEKVDDEEEGKKDESSCSSEEDEEDDSESEAETDKTKPMASVTNANTSSTQAAPVAVTTPTVSSGQPTPTSPIKKYDFIAPIMPVVESVDPASWRQGLRKTGIVLVPSKGEKSMEKDSKGTKLAYVTPTIPRRLASTSDIEEKENSCSFGRRQDDLISSSVPSTTSTPTVTSAAGLQKSLLSSTSTTTKITTGSSSAGTQSSTSNRLWAEDSTEKEKDSVPTAVTIPVAPTVVNAAASTTTLTTTTAGTVSSTAEVRERRRHCNPLNLLLINSMHIEGVTLTDLQEAEKTIGRSRSTRTREQENEEKEEKEKQDKEKQEEKKESETSREDEYKQKYSRTYDESDENEQEQQSDTEEGSNKKEVQTDSISRYEISSTSASDRYDSLLGRSGSYSYSEERKPYSSRLEKDDSTDFKKLYEQILAENEKLKAQLHDTNMELTDLKLQLEKATQRQERFADRSLLEMEKRERRALERRISEMEEELKFKSVLPVKPKDHGKECSADCFTKYRLCLDEYEDDEAGQKERKREDAITQQNTMQNEAVSLLDPGSSYLLQEPSRTVSGRYKSTTTASEEDVSSRFPRTDRSGFSRYNRDANASGNLVSSSSTLEKKIEDLEKEVVRERQENLRLVRLMQDKEEMIGKLKEEIDLLNRDLDDIEDENEQLKQENKTLLKVVGQLTR
ncbi:hypothetical protein E5288_WYG013531 [Bos mutus]|uniref:Protein phosphatase 1 regulatory subunit n=1 Tax=Bos mutus TaxID=72004 RepID=A0A6B0QV11_9CETA|nr:hypothetical protein [Bos mutus]